MAKELRWYKTESTDNRKQETQEQDDWKNPNVKVNLTKRNTKTLHTEEAEIIDHRWNTWGKDGDKHNNGNQPLAPCLYALVPGAVENLSFSGHSCSEISAAASWSEQKLQLVCTSFSSCVRLQSDLLSLFVLIFRQLKYTSHPITSKARRFFLRVASLEFSDPRPW